MIDSLFLERGEHLSFYKGETATCDPHDYVGTVVHKPRKDTRDGARHHAAKEKTPLDLALERLDLTVIKAKLCKSKKKGGQGWSAGRCDRVEAKYKKFLRAAYFKRQGVPDDEVDQIWHAHILNTPKYHADCKAIFGTYLHHLPNCEDDAKAMCTGDKGECGISCGCYKEGQERDI